jgi:alpha-D-ribose 1-methylphosphonate 5-phosphate C-P lyase
MTEPLIVECKYCGHSGPYPDELILERRSGFVCKDTDACDARDAENNPEDF